MWDVDRFREDFRRSECYWAPLKLEAAESTHFLETTLDLNPSGRAILKSGLALGEHRPSLSASSLPA